MIRVDHQESRQSGRRDFSDLSQADWTGNNGVMNVMEAREVY